MKVFLLLVSVCFQFTSIYCLTCQVCNRAKALEQCTEITHCAPGQECFVDELVNANGVFFNAGCRSVEVCNERYNIPFGKRDTVPGSSSAAKRQIGGELVACSRCCAHDLNLTSSTSKPCNTRLCGLPSNAGSGHLTCYECDHVSDFEEDCNGVTTCQDDKVCGSSTHSTTSGSSHTYTFGCYDKRACVALTKKILALQDLLEKRNQTSQGKRSEQLLCNICCGGSYCNTGDCVKLKDKLHELAKYGNLNMDTLEYV